MRNILLILTLFAALAFAREASAQTVILKADTVSVSCASSDTFLIPIRVIDFENIGSFQFTLMWDTAKLDYAYTTPINPLLLGAGVDFDSNTTQINAGKIAFIWTKTTGATVPDSTVIFNLAFRRIGGSFASLMFVNAPVPIEVANVNGDILTTVTMTGGVKPLDDKAPTISCPDNVTVQGNGPTPVNGIAPFGITDNCAPVASVGWTSSGATITNAPNDPDASGAPFNIGVSTVIYTVTDVGGNTATCSFTVTVELSNISDTLTILAQNVNTSCAQTVSVDITALNFDSLGSLQFSIGWNQAVLQFSSVSNFNPALLLILGDNFNTTQTASGLLAFLWTADDPAAGVTLPPGAVLFTINLNVTGGGSTNSPITFGDIPVPREAVSVAGGNSNVISAFWINGSVNVQDNVPPILECPQNVEVALPNGNTNVQVNGLEPQALLDNCGGTPALTYVRTGATPGSGAGSANGIYNPGLTTVTYTATDQAGNTSTCSFTVAVTAAGALTLLIDSVAVDCQGGDSIGVNIFVENWDDIFGLQFSVEWDETVLQFSSVGNFNPSLNLTPGDFGTTQTGNGILSFLAGGSSSNWPQQPNGSVVFTIYFNVLNPGASSAISYTGFIEAINSALNTVPVVTVNGLFSGGGADNTPPTVTCPANITTFPLDACTALVNVPLPETDDDCSGVASIVRVPAGNIFLIGSTTVTYTVADSAGNSATCSLTVTVQDGTPPVVICPANITVNAAPSACNADVNVPLPLATDDCTGIDSITRVPDGNVFDAGTTTVIYTVTDSSGNSANCSFSVTVIEDNPPQFLTCPTNITGHASGFSCEGQVNWNTPVVTDPCGQNNLTLISNFMPGSVFPVGSTFVVYMVTDASNNSATCSFLVTILDTIVPILLCPGDLTVFADGSVGCSAVVNYDFPVTIDNCGDSSVVIIGGPLSGSVFPPGGTTVSYTAVDGSNNISSCSFVVTVVDINAPTLACPYDIIVTANQDSCGAFVTWEAVTAADDCDTTLTPSSNFQSGQFFPVGTTVVTYTVTDDSGNSTTCSFSVTVDDIVPPIIVGCPPGVLLTLLPGDCDTTVFWDEPFAADNCDDVESFISSHTSGSIFPAGTTVVTYTVLDGSGNSATCTFNVVVVDQIPPVLINCPTSPPPDTTGPCGIPVSWIPPTVTDNCTPDSAIAITSSHTSGSIFLNGETTVFIYAQDASGNYDTCSFLVKIVASTQPGWVNVPQNIFVTGCAQPVSWIAPDTVGICIADTLYSSHQPGDTFYPGTTIVSYTVVDQNGMATTATFNVTVTETEPPVFTPCPEGPIVVNVGGGVVSDPSEFLFSTDTVAGCDGVELEFDLPTAMDDCGLLSLAQTDGGLPGAVFPMGLDTLVFTAVDSSGNTALCSVVIEVQELPALNPVSNPPLGCAFGPVTITAASIPGAIYTWTKGQTPLSSTTNVHFISEFAPNDTGTYNVSAIVNGCPAPSGSVLLEAASDPFTVDDTDIVVAPGDTIVINVFANDDLVPLSDFCITQISPANVPGLDTLDLCNGTFSFQAPQIGGTVLFRYTVCSKSCPTACDSAAVTIAVREPDDECKVPNIFTPNEDDFNQYLEISCLKDPRAFPDNSFVVYNQWGDKVFEAKGYENNWDGTLNGEPGKNLPDGTYFYIFKPGPGEPVLKGFVEIFR